MQAQRRARARAAHLPPGMLARVIRQRSGDAERQRVSWYLGSRLEHDRAISFVRELAGKDRAKRRDEIGLAVKIHGVVVGLRLLPVYADGAAASALRSHVGRFSPLERFLEMAYPIGRGRGLEDQRT